MIPVGFYRPDIAATNPGVSGAVLNAILKKDAAGVSYGPHPSHQPLATSDALAAAPRGAISVVTRAGAYQVYVGTADSLYQLSADGSVTQIGTGYAVPAGNNWGMAQFGDYVYFTNTFDGMLRYDVEAGGAVSAVSGAPKARFICPLFGTLAALDCDGNNRVMKTSKINDGSVWSGDASNTYQEFVDGEELISAGEIGAQFAIIFQRNAIRLLTRTRDRSIFVADLLELGKGAQGAGGCVYSRGWAYFIDTDGFHRTNGQLTESIGEDKVSRTFIASLAAGALVTAEGAYDPANNRVVWRYQKSGVSSTTVFEDALAYEIRIGEWVPLAVSLAAIINLASPGYSLDDLDQFGTMETLPYPLDSSVWKGGEPRLAGINGDLKFGYFDGSGLAATIETGSLGPGPWGRYTGITPITDNGAATIQLGVKRSLNDNFTWGDAVSIDDDGFCPVDEGGLVHAYRFNAAAGDSWTYLRGFDQEMATFGGPR